MLDQAVDEALNEFPQHRPDRSRLIAQMIQALESDPSWVELYGITGELKVPTSKDEGTPKEILSQVREVGYPMTYRVVMRRDRLIRLQMVGKGRPTIVRNSPWRELRIQVDVPLMDASFHPFMLASNHVLMHLCYCRSLPQCNSAFKQKVSWWMRSQRINCLHYMPVSLSQLWYPFTLHSTGAKDETQVESPMRCGLTLRRWYEIGLSVGESVGILKLRYVRINMIDFGRQYQATTPLRMSRLSPSQ